MGKRGVVGSGCKEGGRRNAGEFGKTSIPTKFWGCGARTKVRKKGGGTAAAEKTGNDKTQRRVP